MPENSFHKGFKTLFANNIRRKGLKAAIFALGLGASRYIEYSVALNFSKRAGRRGLVVELGCGHSLLPSIWAEMALRVIAVDINEEALKWQKSISRNRQSGSGSPVQAIRASATELPFRNSSISTTLVISVIEHIHCDTDATREIGRILEPRGLSIISVPLSGSDRTIVRSGYATGIPSVYRRFLGSGLLGVLKLFRVDRGATHFERFYGSVDVRKRLVDPSGCIMEDFVTLRSKLLVRIIHGKLIPTSVLSFLEFALARYFVVTGKSMTNMDAVILAARKAKKVNR